MGVGTMHDAPSLQTDRLVLRAFRLDDAPAVQVYAGRKEIADTTLTIPHPYPDGAAEAWIQTHRQAWDLRSHVTYAIETHAGELVGCIGMALTFDHQRAELGYWIRTESWGNGYATEAAQALIAFGFSHLHLHRIQAHHFERNPQSGRVMQKIGMTFEGLMRDAIRKGDRFENTAMYAILVDEWRAQSGHAAG